MYWGGEVRGGAAFRPRMDIWMEGGPSLSGSESPWGPRGTAARSKLTWKQTLQFSGVFVQGLGLRVAYRACPPPTLQLEAEL